MGRSTAASLGRLVLAVGWSALLPSMHPLACQQNGPAVSGQGPTGPAFQIQALEAPAAGPAQAIFLLPHCTGHRESGFKGWADLLPSDPSVEGTSICPLMPGFDCWDNYQCDFGLFYFSYLNLNVLLHKMGQ